MGQIDNAARRMAERFIAELCGLGWDMRGMTAALEGTARANFARYAAGSDVSAIELAPVLGELAALVRESRELSDYTALEEVTR